MSKQTDKSLFMLSPVAVKQSGFYQQILSGVASFQQLGNRVLQQIKAAHAFRQVETVRELSRILVNIPIREYQLIAQYYLVWCHCRKLEYDNELLEQIIERTQTYKTKALLSRAGFELHQGHTESAFYFYTEATNTTTHMADYLELSRCIAVAKSIEGFHESALKDLEKLIPLIRHAEPLTYYDFLNSYAVELNKAGRRNEARNISRAVLTSPFAFAYPEWQETADELREANRSFAAVSTIQPESNELTSPQQSTQEQPAKVYLFPKLQGDAPQIPKPQTISADKLKEMSVAEMRAMLLALAYDKQSTKDEYEKMLMSSSLVQKEEGAKEIDLESDSNLEQIIIHWLNEETSPEQLTATLLRNCSKSNSAKKVLILLKKSDSG